MLQKSINSEYCVLLRGPLGSYSLRWPYTKFADAVLWRHKSVEFIKPDEALNLLMDQLSLYVSNLLQEELRIFFSFIKVINSCCFVPVPLTFIINTWKLG